MRAFSPVRRLALLALLLPATFRAAAQQNVGIGTAMPDGSAALDIVNSGKGLLLPR